MVAKNCLPLIFASWSDKKERGKRKGKKKESKNPISANAIGFQNFSTNQEHC